MARTHVVKSARKAQGPCQSPRCLHDTRAIEPGMPYKWFSIRSHRAARGMRRVYHVDCRVPDSHRTTSPHLATIYDAVEAAYDALDDLSSDTATADDIRIVASEAAEGIREAAYSYRESAENIESGFGHATAMSDELNEKADMVESWADDLEGVDVDDWDEDAAESMARDEGDDDMTDDDVAEAVAAARDEWFDACCDEVRGLLEANPL